MSNKRQIHDKIDIFFLLNENKVVTRSELRKLLPKENYDEYIKGFYKRRIIDVFQRYSEFPWFINKYCKDNIEWKNWEFKFLDKYLYVEGLQHEDDLELIKEIEEVKRYALLFNDTRLPILILEVIDTNINEKIFNLYPTREINIKEIEITDVQDAQECSDNVLQRLNKLYNTNISVKEMIKKTFLYCTVCNIQYSSDLEMAYKCKDHANTPLSKRRLELLNNYSDFKYIKNTPEEFIIKSNIIKLEDKAYQCAYCDKKFESIEYINLHYNKKHALEIEKRKNIIDNFKKFIDNLDLPILYLADGSNDEIPWYAKNLDDHSVVYDMNHIFSGEIILE